MWNLKTKIRNKNNFEKNTNVELKNKYFSVTKHNCEKTQMWNVKTKILVIKNNYENTQVWNLRTKIFVRKNSIKKIGTKKFVRKIIGIWKLRT